MATETLRPNAVGDEESISSAVSGAGNHWQDVDEATADDATTTVYQSGQTYQRDLYNLPSHSVGSGTINSITIYFRIYNQGVSALTYAKPSQKSGTTVTDGTEVTQGNSWATKSQTYTTNPATANPYTWAEIDALQIGLQLKSDTSSLFSFCTQVYVEVDYTPIVAPTVTTQAVSSIGTTTATGNGNITATGGEDASAWGTCLSVNANPTTADTVDAGSGTGGVGAFTTSIDSLTSGTLYHVRAYATNTGGTGYGGDVSFRTIFTQAVGGGSIAIAGVLATIYRQFKAVGGGSIAIAGSLSTVKKMFLAVGGGSIAIAGTLSAMWRRTQAVGGGSITITGALGRKISVAVGGGSIAIAGGLGRKIAIAVGGGSIAIAGVLVSVYRQFKAVGGGSITIAGTLGRKIAIAVGGGSIAIAGSLSTVKKMFLAVGGGSIAIVGVLGRLIKISVGGGSITIAGVLGRKISIAVGGGSIAIVGSLSTIKKIFQAVGGGSIAIAGTLGRKVAIGVGGGSIAIAGVLGRKIKIAVGGGSIAIAGAIGMKFKLAVGGGTIAIAGGLSIIKKMFQAVGGGTIAISGILSPIVYRFTQIKTFTGRVMEDFDNFRNIRR